MLLHVERGPPPVREDDHNVPRHLLLKVHRLLEILNCGDDDPFPARTLKRWSQSLGRLRRMGSPPRLVFLLGRSGMLTFHPFTPEIGVLGQGRQTPVGSQRHSNVVHGDVVAGVSCRQEIQDSTWVGTVDLEVWGAAPYIFTRRLRVSFSFSS